MAQCLPGQSEVVISMPIVKKIVKNLCIGSFVFTDGELGSMLAVWVQCVCGCMKAWV